MRPSQYFLFVAWMTVLGCGSTFSDESDKGGDELVRDHRAPTTPVAEPAQPSNPTAIAPVPFSQPPPWADRVPPQKGESVSFEDFVGSRACSKCHQDQAKQWRKSSHGKAGGPPKPSRMAAKFDGRWLTFTDARVQLVTKRDGPYFRIQEQKKAERWIKVAAVIGRGHMEAGGAQTYFEEQADGRLVMLPFDFAVADEKWFCQTKGRSAWSVIDGGFALTDCEWPAFRTLGFDTGENCQNCHGSQIELTFDEAQRRYVTRFVELDINCESCHGPGRRHIELMGRENRHELTDIGMQPLVTLSKEASVAVCLDCHAAKSYLTGDYLPGDRRTEHLAINTLQLQGERVLHPNGWVKTFSYQEGHLYSSCYLDGSMTCVDCHDPHSLNYRDIYGVGLEGRYDDRQCTGCHAAKKDGGGVNGHAGHSNLRCTDCHMPPMQHPAVGSEIKVARADHTISIPRPGWAERLGPSNACDGCHSDRGILWQREQVKNMYGPLKKPSPIVDALITFDQRAAMSGPEAERAGEALLNLVSDHFPAASIYAISEMLDVWLLGRALTFSEVARDQLRTLAESEDLELASVALAALMVGEVGNRTEWAIYSRLSQDPEQRLGLERLVLHNLITVLFRIDGFVNQNSDRRASIDMGRHGLLRSRVLTWSDRLDDGEIMDFHSIGSFFATGEHKKAEALIDAALEGKKFAAGTYSVGHEGTRHELLRQKGLSAGASGDVRRAIAILKKALSLNPNDIDAHSELCRIYVENRRSQAAAECLEQLLALDPRFVDGHFLLGNVLEALGQTAKAILYFEKGLGIDPNPMARRRLAELKAIQAEKP